MNQHVFYHYQKTLLLIALMLLHAAFISNATAIESVTPLQSDTNFRILYHEPLGINIQPQTSGSNSLLNSTNQANGEALNLSFEAYGIFFELILESNQQLISNLPLEQQQQLNQSLKLYRGKLKDNDASWVRITLQDNQVSGMIWDGDEIYIIDNPKDVSGILSSNQDLQSAASLIYRLSDTEAGNQSCAFEPNSYSVNNYSGLINELKENIEAQAATVAQLDMAIVADTQFANIHSNPSVAVVARMNVVDGIYSEQVGVHLNLTDIDVLTDNAGLTESGAFGLLDQFSNFANSAGFNNPGLAHLFTGRDLNGSTIGVAWIGALCSKRFGTGLSQIRGTGTAGALTIAHEVGHNFGADHDNQSGSPCASTPNGFIMNPFLNGSDQFSQCSLDHMQVQIQNAACIIDAEAPSGTDVRSVLPQSTIAAKIDEDFDFQVEVRNSGQITALNVMADISIPDELVVQDATVIGGSCQTINKIIQCDLDEINAQSVKTINIKLQASDSGRFFVNVEISADNDNSPTNNTSQVTINVEDETVPTTISEIFEAHFNKGRDGFIYIDDAFRNTNQPAYAQGSYTKKRGFRGGGLKVITGKNRNTPISTMSGGWERTFSLENLTPVTVSFRYKLTQDKNFTTNEFSEALMSIDGVLLSPQAGTDYLARIQGNGRGGKKQTTGWRVVSLDLGNLSTGDHSIVIGTLSNKTAGRRKATSIVIDDVVMTQTTQP